MVRLGKKHAFSMLEATITMLMVAVFTAAASNVFTQKHQKVAHHTSHGSFECFYNEEDQLCQSLSQEGIAQEPSCGLTECSFRPMKAAEYYVVNAIGGGGGGYTNGLGGSAGEFRTFFLSNIAKEIKIVPGRGGLPGTTPEKGGDTLIRNLDGELLLIAYGGHQGYYSTSSYVNTIRAGDIYACSLWFEENSTAMQSCASANYTPYCSISSSSISARYCSDADSTSLPTTSNMYFDNAGQLYWQNWYMSRGRVRMYLYVREEVLNFNRTTGTHPSKLDEYLQAIDRENMYVEGAGVGGRGGSGAGSGFPGAVLIVW